MTRAREAPMSLASLRITDHGLRITGTRYCMPAIPLILLCAVAISTASAASDPDADWQQIEALEQRLNESPPEGTNAVDFYADRAQTLHQATAQFIVDHPEDVRIARVTLLKIQTTQFPSPPAERLAILDANEREATVLVRNASLPLEVRKDLERAVLRQRLNHPDLITTAAQAATLESKLASFVSNHPEDPRFASFQLARANLLFQVDPDRAKAFLTELARSDDSKLAQAAKARLVKAELIGNPLELRFTALDGSAFDLERLRGKVVLVDFWASWCPDCLREFPTVRTVYEKFKDRLEVVGISLDKDQKALRNFISRKQVPWPQYSDGKGWQNEIATRFGVGSIPELWLIDRDGRVVATSVRIQDLETKVAALVGR
jgi:thiol-disulfide isomerase/thioredoxin